MAQRNQLKAADQVDLTADDPFAELTRIMGFDPRRPDAAPAARNTGSRPVEPSVEDDFGIDLEKELMGEFQADDGETDAEAAGMVPDEPADETAAQDFAEAAVESMDIDADGLAREIAPALDEDGDAGEDLVALELGATEPIRDLMPSDGRPFEDEFEEDVQDLDLIAGDSAVEAVTDDDVDEDVELELDPGELDVELARPVDALRLDDDVEDAEELEAAALEQTGGWGQQAAWQHVDDGRDDDFPEIDLAIGDADGNPEQWVGSQSASDAENDGFDHAADHFAPDQADPPDYEAGLQAADAADAVADEGGGRFEDDAFFDDGEAGAPVSSGDWPNDMAASAHGQDELPSEAVAAGSPSTATEFSLEDELNALLGNIKAAGLASAAAAAAAAAARGRETPRHADPAPVPAAAEDLPDFDDADFEQALADGLDSAEDPARAVPAGAAEEDLLDALDAIAASYVPRSPASWGRGNPSPLADAAGAAQAARAAPPAQVDFASAIFDAPPDIETVEVADRPLALADDLDIPDLDYQEAVPPAAAYDDLDAEFANLLNDMNLGEPAQPRAAEPHARVDAEQAHAAFEYAADAAAPSDAPLPGTADDGDASLFALDADDLPGSLPLEAGFDPDGPYDEAPAMVTPAVARRPQRRGLLFAGIVGAVALAGGVGALALSFGGSWSGMPALVKADRSPVKVKPEKPGGTTVPNQDNAVYETVAGAAPAGQSQQEKLVTTAEEPIDVSPPLRDEAEEMADVAALEDEMTAEPQPKGEDRIAQILQETEASDANAAVTAVAPRKVRTMIVRPDGTLVPREEPAVAEELAAAAVEATREAAAPAGEEEMMGPMAAAVPDETGSVRPADAAAAAAAEVAPSAEANAAPGTPAVANTIETAAIEANSAASPDGAAAATGTEAAEPSSSSLVMPEIAPIAPQRPAQQPIDVVGEVKPDKVAAAAPLAAPAAPLAAPAAGNGAAWSVQIASQPNEAAARSTYQDLAGRYGSVLSGREVSIVKAEVAGRGTFWRVRVPANSRDDAIRLCESYKDAGGNCFVSR